MVDKDQFFQREEKRGKDIELGKPIISPEDNDYVDNNVLTVKEYEQKKQSNVIDKIIQNRAQILELVSKHGVTALKLYGSVLDRKESSHSDIDFLAIFDSSMEYDWEARFEVQEDLEAYLNRTISVVDSRRIPDVFRPSIDIDPIDIMDLSSDIFYSISPKTSKLYYLMLERVFNEFKTNYSGDFLDSVYMLLAEKISWWFSRLLRLDDNDLREYRGFYYVEVLKLCEKMSTVRLEEYSNEDMKRFKELVEEVREYVHLRYQEWKVKYQI